MKYVTVTVSLPQYGSGVLWWVWRACQLYKKKAALGTRTHQDSERELLYDDIVHVEARAYAHLTDFLISTITKHLF